MRLSIPSWALCAVVLAAAASAQVKISSIPGKVDVQIDGQPYTTFYVDGSGNKPYLHPLRAADGKIVTRMYPMEKKAGEVTDHIHHRGLWFTHGDVNGLDFWANDESQKNPKKGMVVLEKLGKLKSGRKSGSVSATFVWRDPTGKTILREERTMTFHSHPQLRIIDIDTKFIGVESAKFGDTKEGFFAIRLATEMDGRHTGKLFNAEGKSGEKEVWGKRSPWVDYVGKVEGNQYGVAIFDHPTNPKHPTYWHARDYGLFAANIFGEHDFYNDKKRDGSMTLEPKQTWRFRYRVVIHPGDTAGAAIGDLYTAWAKTK